MRVFMAKQTNELPELSKPEYDVLRVLWKKGQQSVREVHEIMEKRRGWALTTTRTVMDRMVNKKLIDKRNFHGVFVYSPLITRPVGLAKMVQYFAESVLETDTNTVVSMFSNTTDMTPEEVDKLRNLLDEDK